MAEIQTANTIHFDRETVYTTFREKLSELSPYLPDIREIELESYDEIDDSTTKIVRIWKAAADEIPSLLSKFIDPDKLQWTDYATWRRNRWECDWEMEVNFLTDAIACHGTNRFIEKNGATEIAIDGQLEVDTSKIKGVPSFLGGKVESAIENFVVRLITPNLDDVCRGLEEYLEDNKAS